MGKVQCGEWRAGERSQVEHFGVAEVEREPAVLADREAFFQRVLGGNREVFQPREPVFDEEFVLLAEQPRHGHQFRGGALLPLHGEVQLRHAFASELAILTGFRGEQFVTELRRGLRSGKARLHAQGFAIDRGGFGKLELALEQITCRHEILGRVGSQLHGVVELCDGLTKLLFRREGPRLFGKRRCGRT